MNVMKKISIALSAAAILASSSFGAQVLTGGNIPLVNSITGIGVVTLDFGSPGVNVVIATFILNNNSQEFDVDWTLANNAEFRNAAGTAIVMTTAVLNPVTPGVGLGTARLAAADLANVSVAGGAGTWNYLQSTATVNYAINLTASWADPSGFLAGLYTENVTFSVTATL